MRIISYVCAAFAVIGLLNEILSYIFGFSNIINIVFDQGLTIVCLISIANNIVRMWRENKAKNSSDDLSAHEQTVNQQRSRKYLQNESAIFLEEMKKEDRRRNLKRIVLCSVGAIVLIVLYLK